MFSQQGVDSSGSSTNAYENFNPSSPDSGSFSPNFYINGETGKMVATNATIKGSFEITTSLVEGDHSGFGLLVIIQVLLPLTWIQTKLQVKDHMGMLVLQKDGQLMLVAQIGQNIRL